MRFLLFIAFLFLQFPGVAESPSLPTFRAMPLSLGIDGPMELGAALAQLSDELDAAETVEPESPRPESASVARNWTRPILASSLLPVPWQEQSDVDIRPLSNLSPRAPPISQA